MGKDNKKEKLKAKKNLRKAEHFVMHQEDEGIAKVENLARSRGITKSWLYRAVLRALEKKFAGGLPDKYEIKRPRRFNTDFRQTTICFYGDRQKWFSLCRIWKVELGPLIRFGLALYEAGELELDLESEDTVKEVKMTVQGKKQRQKIENFEGKSNRYRYLYQNISSCYNKNEFWRKNPEGNLELMKWGLKNRLYPLKLPENFQIPSCFGG